jgi:hypothetical protein
VDAVFTGLDLVVILMVVGVIIYATRADGGGGAVKIDALTWLVLVIVVGMIVISLT